MVYDYNRRRYRTPSTFSQLMEANDRSLRLNEALRESEKELKQWRSLAESFRHVLDVLNDGRREEAQELFAKAMAAYGLLVQND